MHHVTALLELLYVLAQGKLGVRVHVLLLLLLGRRRASVLAHVDARASAELRVGIAVGAGRGHGEQGREDGNGRCGVVRWRRACGGG